MPPQQLDLAANANGTTGGSEPEIVLEQAAQPACAICHKVEVAVGPVENRVTLQRCGRCRQVLYCSRDCQRAHWPRHKSDCAAPGSPPEKIDDATDARAARLVASAPKENCLEETIKSVAKEFVCPITHELPVEPVTAEDGRIYDRNGSEIGQLLLGKAFAKGLYGLSKDLVRARFWLEKADHDEARELLQELGQ